MKKNKALSIKEHYYKIIPLALILLIVPAIVFLKYSVLKGVALDFSTTGETNYDLFAYYKSLWLIVFTSLSVVFCIFYMKLKNIKLKLPIIFVPFFVYYLFVFLSSALSKYHEQAFGGFNGRFEGFFVISCYVLICFMSATFITYEKDIKILFGALIICGFILSILGIAQFFGFDFFQSNFGKHLILPKEHHNLINILDFKFPKQYIYSTLYNPNYVGSFFSMLLPLGIAFSLLSKKVYKKVIFIVFSCVSFINLVGCLSKTGYIASAFSVILLIVLLNKNFFKAWRTVLILLVSFTFLLFLMNNVSNGTILPSLNLSSVQTSQAQPSRLQSLKEKVVEVKEKLLQPEEPQLLKMQTVQTARPQPLAQPLQNSHPYTLKVQPYKPQASQQLRPIEVATTPKVSSTSQVGFKRITDFSIDKNNIKIFMGNNVVNVNFDSSNNYCIFTDEFGENVDILRDSSDPNLTALADPRFERLSIKYNGNYIKISALNTSFNVYISPEEKVFKFVDHKGRPTEIASPESIGFNGYESWGSSRGYIWSRSLPLIKDTLFIGHGPDTFALYFPQNEFNSKLKYFDTPYILVDKPHNMYIQMAINTGVISLVAFIVFVLWFIISAIRLYIKPKAINTYYLAGVSCVTAVLGYLIAGLANDSVVGVSSVFWILLGLGISCNRLYSNSISAAPLQKQKLYKR